MWAPSTRAWLTSRVTGMTVRSPSVTYFPQVIRGLLSAGLGTGWRKSVYRTQGSVEMNSRLSASSPSSRPPRTLASSWRAWAAGR